MRCGVAPAHAPAAIPAVKPRAFSATKGITEMAKERFETWEHQPTSPATKRPTSRNWLITLADQTTRVVEAHSFRVEGGGLILVLPAGCAAAYAHGTWLTIEAAE
jgi:hypothetical protein